SHDLVATIDGREVAVTESLIRTQLHFDDANGIFDMPINDILEGMRVISPYLFDSLVKQFWATAVVRPNAAGSHDLVATFDGREVVVTESQIRRLESVSEFHCHSPYLFVDW
ncbi:hypothetical protein Tco_0172334, partial [Tanacetum coccineum]